MQFSSGDIKRSYEVCGLVYTYGSTTDGIFKEKNIKDAYRIATKELGDEAKMNYGADAVIYIHLEHRVAVDKGVLQLQCFEVVGYGTAVRFIEDSYDAGSGESLDDDERNDLLRELRKSK